ncbi:MAG: hypothetical protein Q9227_001700 [Pyrenula ochraceoflavens]
MVYFPDDEYPIRDENHQLAVRSYNKAISRFNEMTRQGAVAIPLALVSCILFICIEFLQDNLTHALKLYAMGCNLLRDQAGSPDNPQVDGIDQSHIRKLVGPILFRLGILSVLSGGPTPPEYFEKSGHDAASDLWLGSLTQSRSALHSIMIRGHAFIRKGTIHARYTPFGVAPADEMLREQARLVSELESWHSNFSDLLRRKGSSIRSSERALAATLFMWCIASKTWILTCLSPFETEIDQYTHLIEAIISHAKVGISYAAGQNGSKAPFTFEMGVIPPLYVAALRCRHPRIRREAHALLQKAPQREGPWKSAPMARMLDRVFELEEENLYSAGIDFTDPAIANHEWRLPPEEKRLHAHRLFKDHNVFGEPIWCLQYELRTMNDEDEWMRTDHVITMDNLGDPTGMPAGRIVS